MNSQELPVSSPNAPLDSPEDAFTTGPAGKYATSAKELFSGKPFDPDRLNHSFIVSFEKHFWPDKPPSEFTSSKGSYVSEDTLEVLDRTSAFLNGKCTLFWLDNSQPGFTSSKGEERETVLPDGSYVSEVTLGVLELTNAFLNGKCGLFFKDTIEECIQLILRVLHYRSCPPGTYGSGRKSDQDRSVDQFIKEYITTIRSLCPSMSVTGSPSRQQSSTAIAWHGFEKRLDRSMLRALTVDLGLVWSELKTRGESSTMNFILSASMTWWVGEISTLKGLPGQVREHIPGFRGLEETGMRAILFLSEDVFPFLLRPPGGRTGSGVSGYIDNYREHQFREIVHSYRGLIRLLVDNNRLFMTEREASYLCKRFDAGLIREGQIWLITTTINNLMAELSCLMKEDADSNALLEAVKRQGEMVEFLSGERFRSERLEVLLEKHVREEGVNIMVVHEIRRLTKEVKSRKATEEFNRKKTGY